MPGCGRKCVVVGCKMRQKVNKTLTFSRFPTDAERCRQWVRLAGDPDLMHLPVERLNSIRFMCSQHFQEEDYVVGEKIKRLKKTAVPSLFPEGHHFLDENEVAENFLCGFATTTETTLNTLCNMEQMVDNRNIDMDARQVGDVNEQPGDLVVIKEELTVENIEFDVDSLDMKIDPQEIKTEINECIKEEDTIENDELFVKDELENDEWLDEVKKIECSYEETNEVEHDLGEPKLNNCNLSEKDNMKRSKMEYYKCNFCHYTTEHKSNLCTHFNKEHLSTEEYKCDLCNYKTNKRRYMTRHVAMRHSEVKYHKCDLCEYRTQDKCNLFKHVTNRHSNAEDLKCDVCEYKTNSKYYMSAHVRYQHGNVKYIECEMCKYKTKYRSSLSRHVRSKHPDVDDVKSTNIRRKMLVACPDMS